MSFWKSFGHFVTVAARDILRVGQELDPALVAMFQASGMTGALEANTLITSAVGDTVDAVHRIQGDPTQAAQIGTILGQDLWNKFRAIALMFENHPQAPPKPQPAISVSFNAASSTSGTVGPGATASGSIK